MVARGDLQKEKSSINAPLATQDWKFLPISFYSGLLQNNHFVGAFLYGRFNTPIYLELPNGLKKKEGKNKVWKTYCALQELAEAAGACYETIFSKILVSRALPQNKIWPKWK